MDRFNKKKVHPQILRSYLDVKHERWLYQYFPFVMLAGVFGAIGIVASMFFVHPTPKVGAFMAFGAILLALTPYAAMVFLAPGKQRLKILIGFVAAIAWIAAIWSLLSWLAPSGRF